ncbi:transposase [Sporolactobacillus inulinus]|uniref:transposase n=1 Tax=Sporolactobacillus inulinus TaxID=2078 RepID=UPI000255BDE3|nr:transposase [Sporolactobacillus inulinus]GEB76407.1 hypothetical protein SIN01_07520 [Sporolactobacillus inulinus]
MAIIPQTNLFSWIDFNVMGDLERLRLVLDYLPDEKLVSQWEDERKNGCNDYPIRAVWNSFLAGIVFQHLSIESLRRELSRNAQLRWLCGFEEDQVPSAAVYTRFTKKPTRDQETITDLFEQLVADCYHLFPAFGAHLVIDSKPIASFVRKNGADGDASSDSDADHSKKSYQGIGAQTESYGKARKVVWL